MKPANISLEDPGADGSKTSAWTGKLTGRKLLHKYTVFCIFMPMRNASILGASGYSGAELIRFLLRHPSVTIEKLFAVTSAGKSIAEVHPAFASRLTNPVETYTPDAACTSDIVFLALPSGEAMHLVPELLSRGKKVIDLGGDFRLRDVSLYQKYYNREHLAPEVLPHATYGLTEWNREAIRTATLVANPGCYPTSSLLPLIPLLRERLIRESGIVINSLSGVSGAGRSSSAELSFAEVNESVKAYKVTVHQHIPEIKMALEKFAARTVQFSFVPHLLPITRGIYTTISAPLNGDISDRHVLDAYKQFYASEPFVRVSSVAIPEIKHTTYTNFIDIGFRVDRENGQLIIFSTLDNLVKGAAGQAVQNMNLMFGFPETEGLL
jgi:N-acetyl-gamma-glutamyl-phosphate reductase